MPKAENRDELMRLLQSHGAGVRKLASDIGLSPSAVSKALSGHTPNLRVEQAVATLTDLPLDRVQYITRVQALLESFKKILSKNMHGLYGDFAAEVILEKIAPAMDQIEFLVDEHASLYEWGIVDSTPP